MKRNYNWFFLRCASKLKEPKRRSMRNGVVAWDGVYGIIHMAAPKLQLWILISALCERTVNSSFFYNVYVARNWLPFSTLRNISYSFHLKHSFSLPLIRLRVSCDATFISFAKKPHVSVHRRASEWELWSGREHETVLKNWKL